jgi:hypothetical protein
MGRGGKGAKTTLTTSEARSSLPALARAAARRAKPSKSLLDNAVEIQSRGEQRSAYLVPQVDVEDATRRIEKLEDELEDIALVRLLEQRVLADSGRLTPVDDVMREFGFHDLLSEAVG